MTTINVKPIDNSLDFVDQEEKLLKHWYETGIIDKYLHKNDAAKKRYSFFDGPITANNPMGVHHGWGRTYKDVWQKYHNLKGFKQRFQNGFDCQGLWVEVEVEKELGFKTKKDIETYGVEKFVNKCKARVEHFAGIQTEQSKRLGYFMDWDNSYFTMSDNNNYMIWHFLKVCQENGWIYKGKDSVPWCPRCQTAISQHEMLTEDYKDVVHKAVYFKLPLIDKQNEYLLVWTTTPWTIPANIAVAIDAKAKYSLVLGENGQKYWIMKDAVERIFKDKPEIKKTVLGSKLVGLKYNGPFDSLPAVAAVAKGNQEVFHTVVATDPLILPITSTEGTGIVHTAVSAGAEDFRLGKLRHLPMIPVIDDEANYLNGLDFLAGQNAKKHPEIILDYLKEHDWVYLIENYKHRYPACWRCKTELVWKVADEWYIAMDTPSKTSKSKTTLRERMKAVAKKIDWIPEFGLDRELDWLSNMHDWLISKPNRYWGLALPIYECDHCGHFEVIGSKEELQQRAIEGWQEFEGHSPHKPWIDVVKISCSHCNKPVSRLSDVGNVWLDAGIIPFSTLIDPKTGKLSYTTDKKYWSQWFPADFITESFPGQFKNWFYSLIAMSTVLEDAPPFKKILGYASMLAEDGRPMHKSWGNAIEFNEGAQKIGVDIMRWVYVRQNPLNNLLFGYKAAGEVRRQFFLILWNSYRFFVNSAHTAEWLAEPNKHVFSKHPLDRWIVSRFNTVHQQVEENLDKFDTFHATQSIEDFVNDLSTWYIRRSRDRINQDSLSTMYYIFKNLSIILSPFMPFVAERMYTNLTNEVSVHLADWPELDPYKKDEGLEISMAQIREAAAKVHAIRKSHNLKVRQPLQQVNVTSNRQIRSDLQTILAEEINVKKVSWTQQKEASEIEVDLDIVLTDDLKAEGLARELVREIQKARKVLGTEVNDQIDVIAPDWPQQYMHEIMVKVKAKSLTKGDTLKVSKA